MSLATVRLFSGIRGPRAFKYLNLVHVYVARASAFPEDLRGGGDVSLYNIPTTAWLHPHFR